MTLYRLSPARIAVVVAFALSCFGIAMYLWSTFGGAVPLRPKGYRVWVPLRSALILPTNAPVRISGVDVGRITGRRPVPGGRWLIELEIHSDHAPLPADTRGLARAKTFFGETYLELTPGTPGAPKLADGGRLPWAQVRAPVELDEVLYALDRRTRGALRQWFEQQAVSIQRRGQDLGDAFGRLEPFADDVTALLASLHAQEGAVRRLVGDTGDVFEALATRRDALRGLIVNGRRATGALAARGPALAATLRAFPAFERESAAANRRLSAFAREADPLVRALRPAARELSPALHEVGAAAPDLDALVRGIRDATGASVRGLPATARFVEDAGALVRELPPFTRQLNPLLRGIDAFRGELTGTVANWTAATQAAGPAGGGRSVHYLRLTNPLNPEGLAQYAQRVGTNRSNPYATAGIARDLARRFEVFDTRSCDRGAPVVASTDTDLLQRVERFALGGDAGTGAPPCLAARPRGATRYPRISPDPR